MDAFSGSYELCWIGASGLLLGAGCLLAVFGDAGLLLLLEAGFSGEVV